MAAVRVVDDLFATPLLQQLLLPSLWRLSTKSNATTATMKHEGSPCAKRTLCSRKRRDEDVLEHSKQLIADRLTHDEQNTKQF